MAMWRVQCRLMGQLIGRPIADSGPEARSDTAADCGCECGIIACELLRSGEKAELLLPLLLLLPVSSLTAARPAPFKRVAVAGEWTFSVPLSLSDAILLFLSLLSLPPSFSLLSFLSLSLLLLPLPLLLWL